MLKCFELKTIVISFKIRVMWRFIGFLCVSSSFKNKVVQMSFIMHETWYITLFGIYYCVEMFIIEKNLHMLEITC